MSLDEVFTENPPISRFLAIKTIRQHGSDVQEFFEEMGEKPEYFSRDVLEWLGY